MLFINQIYIYILVDLSTQSSTTVSHGVLLPSFRQVRLHEPDGRYNSTSVVGYQPERYLSAYQLNLQRQYHGLSLPGFRQQSDGGYGSQLVQHQLYLIVGYQPERYWSTFRLNLQRQYHGLFLPSFRQVRLQPDGGYGSQLVQHQLYLIVDSQPERYLSTSRLNPQRQYLMVCRCAASCMSVGMIYKDGPKGNMARN